MDATLDTRCLEPRAAWLETPRSIGFWSIRSSKDAMQTVAAIFELGAWRKPDPIALFLAAAFVAILVQPLAYRGLGSSLVSLMMPVR
jgi:hypothetical protein